MTKEKETLSVIIPVYNTENYIRRCLDSVLNQSYKNIEVICIDDYSKDSSYSICKEYSNIDHRVIAMKNSKNLGVSETRNIGIEAASGEYICFIDSDDYILPGMFQTMMNYMNTCDFCVCQFATESKSGKRQEYDQIYTKLKDEYTSLDFYKIMINSTHSYEDGIVGMPSNKIYKKSLFSDIRFIGRYGEDYGVADLLNAKNLKVKVCKKTFYIYSFDNEQSLTRGHFNTNKFEFLDVLYRRAMIYSNEPEIAHKTYIKYCNMFLEYYELYLKEGKTLPNQYKKWFDACRKKANSTGILRKKDYIRFKLFSVSPLLYNNVMKIRSKMK